LQNHILFFDLLKSKFDQHYPYRHIPPRCTVNEEGEKISEWVMSVHDLVDFLNQTPLSFQVPQMYTEFAVA